MLDLNLRVGLPPGRTGMVERGAQKVVEVKGGGRSLRTTGGTGRDRTTAEIARGPTTGGATVRGLTSGGMTAQGRTTGEVDGLSLMREGTTIETNDQNDRILEDCPQELRPTANQNRTLGTHLVVPSIERSQPRRRMATTVPSAMPADGSRRLSAAGR